MSTGANSKIIKVNDVVNVDAEHGLVFGYAIVCTIDGEPYFDLNVDLEGIHKGKAVPEEITEDAMFKAWVDASEAGVQMAGNVQHDGPDSGSYYSMFPMTTEIAKALDMTVKKTGLIVAYKPEADILQKFKDGTITGFSIEGARVEYEEIEDD